MTKSFFLHYARLVMKAILCVETPEEKEAAVKMIDHLESSYPFRYIEIIKDLRKYVELQNKPKIEIQLGCQTSFFSLPSWYYM